MRVIGTATLLLSNDLNQFKSTQHLVELTVFCLLVLFNVASPENLALWLLVPATDVYCGCHGCHTYLPDQSIASTLSDSDSQHVMLQTDHKTRAQVCLVSIRSFRGAKLRHSLLLPH